jgi:predicted amidophosphoribosyltransferase
MHLIYPPSCLICTAAGSAICLRCKSDWQQDVKVGQVVKTPLYFTKFYNADTAKLILSAKENGNQIAKDLLANSIVNSLKKLIADLNLKDEIALVGIPSSSAAIRKRGRNHINDLANEVVKISNIFGISVINLPILSISKKVKDQSNLNKLQRMQNLSGAYLAKYPECSIKNLIIIDDLITTGASIQEGIRALSVLNLRPVAIITACAVGAHL